MKNVKKKYKLKKSVKLILFLLVVIIIIVGYNMQSDKKDNNKVNSDIKSKEEHKIKDDYLNEFTNNTGDALDDANKNALINYTNMYFKSLSSLKTEDVRILFGNPNSNEAYLAYNALDLLIKHHKMQREDMRIDDGSFNIKIEKISNDNGNIKVDYREDDNYNFKFLKGITSKGINIESSMTLNNGKIVSVRVSRDNYVMFTNILDTITKEGIDNLMTKYLKEMKEEKNKNDKLIDEAFKNPYKDTKNCPISYDREKAVEYAKKYVNERNPNYTAFDDMGGNCMNFVSQAMHEAGLPMDLEGGSVWKYFGPDHDETTRKYGRSSSWTGTQTFYTYAKENTSKGLCLDADVNLFYADKGDVGQVGFDGSFNHSVIIIDIIKDNDGKVVDLLLDCNTTTFENYPLLAYVYPDKRIIKVLGSN